jgi:large subunit ribosomal protein L4
MSSVKVKTSAGAESGTVELPEAIFGIEPNAAVMHQVVTAQLAARRRGTHNTKTRADVRGGGAKPWRQKGTGRARAGSSRSPMWRGGGVAHGPKPRDYSQRTPKKMVRLALRSALSDRAAEGKVLVIDDWGFDAPRTKDAVAALQALDVQGKALVVLPADDVVSWKSFRNLTTVHLIETDQLNAYDVLCSDVVIFTKASLPGATGDDESSPSASTLARRKTAADKKAARQEAEAKNTARQEADADKADADEAGAKPAKAEPAAKAEEPAAPAKKKVVKKKKIIKKVVKKKAAAPAADGGTDADAGDLPPRMKPAKAEPDAKATDADSADDDGKDGGS